MKQRTQAQLRKLSTQELLDLYEENLCIGSDSCSYYSLYEQALHSARADKARAEIMRRLEANTK